jgi:hypothetical protein
VAILGQHTSPGEPHTQEDFDRLDREMDAMPVKARRTLTRLHLQTEVLVWILQDTTDDLPSETRDKVEEAGVDLYQLEDAYRGEEPDA